MENPIVVYERGSAIVGIAGYTGTIFKAPAGKGKEPDTLGYVVERPEKGKVDNVEIIADYKLSADKKELVKK